MLYWNTQITIYIYTSGGLKTIRHRHRASKSPWKTSAGKGARITAWHLRVSRL